MGKAKVRTTTEAIGYLTHTDAMEAIYREENLCMLDCRYKRPDQLRKVRKFVNNVRAGMNLTALVYKYTYRGTVLGFCRTKKGWMMGLLLKSGNVKDVCIDPLGWTDGSETQVVDVEGTVYAMFRHGYRLVLEPSKN